MTKILKKHKYKLLTLMLSIVSIFTLFLGINKTYAYESDTFSYTMTLYTDSTYSTELTPSTNYSYENTIDIRKSDYIYFNLKDYQTSININRFYFLVNYYLINRNTGTIISANNNNITFQYQPYGYSYITAPRSNTLQNNMYTYITQFNNYNNISYVPNYVSFQVLFPTILDGSTTSMIIKNIDIVQSSDIGLTQYYETYYGQIEDNYNALLSDYNDLQDNYDTLETNYDTLQDNYDALEDDYNELQYNYDALENKTSFGIFGYLQDANFQYNIQNNPFITINNKIDLTLNDMQQFGIISSGGNYQAYYFETNYNPNYYGVISNFYFSNSLPLTLIDLTFKDMDGAIVEIVDDEGGNARFNITSSLQNIDYKLLLETYPLTSNFIDEIHITPNNAELMGVMYTSDSYNVGYLYGTQIGYRNGVNSQQNTIDTLNNQIDTLNNQITELEQTSESQYNIGYRNGYEVGSNEDFSQSGFTTLLNGIMSYPVNMLKSLFNFEFMGINLFAVLTFFVSLGIVIFVIHRFKK